MPVNSHPSYHSPTESIFCRGEPHPYVVRFFLKRSFPCTVLKCLRHPCPGGGPPFPSRRGFLRGLGGGRKGLLGGLGGGGAGRKGFLAGLGGAGLLRKGFLGGMGGRGAGRKGFLAGLGGRGPL